MAARGEGEKKATGGCEWRTIGKRLLVRGLGWLKKKLIGSIDQWMSFIALVPALAPSSQRRKDGR